MQVSGTADFNGNKPHTARPLIIMRGNTLIITRGNSWKRGSYDREQDECRV
jgi:hypothetical protein